MKYVPLKRNKKHFINKNVFEFLSSLQAAIKLHFDLQEKEFLINGENCTQEATNFNYLVVLEHIVVYMAVTVD